MELVLIIIILILLIANLVVVLTKNNRLQTERLEQKAQLITQRLKHCNSNWEDAFFITLPRNFGFGIIAS